MTRVGIFSVERRWSCEESVISSGERVGVSGISTSSRSDELRCYERGWWERVEDGAAGGVVARRQVSVSGHRATEAMEMPLGKGR